MHEACMQQHMHHLGLGHLLVSKITQQLLTSSTGGHSNGDDGCLCWASCARSRRDRRRATQKRRRRERLITKYIYIHIYMQGLPDVMFDNDEWLRLREARRARASDAGRLHDS